MIGHWASGLRSVSLRRWLGFTRWMLRIWYGSIQPKINHSLDDEADRTMFDG